MTDEVEILDQEDLDLNYTREIRKKIVESIVVDGKVPNDNRDRRVLLETLDGIDHAALTRKKIKVESESNNKVAIAINTITEIFNDPRITNLGKDDNASGEVKKLDSSLPNADIVEGELDIDSKITMDEFNRINGIE